VNKIKWLLVLAALWFAVNPVGAAPEWKDVPAPPGSNYYWEVASKTWKVITGSDGSLNTSAGTATPTYVTPVSDKRGSIRSFATFNVTLATNSVTLLSSLASFTPPCIVRLQGRGVWYFLENATSTVSSVASGTRLGAYDVFTLSPELGTLNISMVAATDSAVFVHGSIDTTAP
jgi:hypothetical protein